MNPIDGHQPSRTPRASGQAPDAHGRGGTERAGTDTARSGDWELIGRPHPDAPDQRVVISGPVFSVGREAGSGLWLANPTVSTRHAEFVESDGALAVRDLGSKNGTFVNGRRVTGTTALQDGDMLQFGTAVFEVRRYSGRGHVATLCVDVADDALALCQFDKLFSDSAAIPFFQPIVRLADSERIGYEVLARSRLVGLQSAEVMFRVAGELDQAPQLSNLLRREGLRVGRELLGTAKDFYLNTHPRELTRPGLIDTLREARAAHQDVSMVLEIHESVVASPLALRELRRQLTDLDIRLAYDDFGAGRSRLMELVEVPPDVLKFDLCLIRGLPDSWLQQRLLKSLVQILLDLGIVPLAEGVETPEEAAICGELGFPLAQGYFFGRPAPAKAWVG